MTQLFDRRYDRESAPSGTQTYDVALDGQSFYMIEDSQDRGSRIVVVENWVAEFEQVVLTN